MPERITVVTGNPHKLRELQSIFGDEIELDYMSLELEELQSEPAAIISHKINQAHDQIGRPVIVEDVSAGIKSLDWLPGPYIKHFQEKLGGSALYQLSHHPDSDQVRAVCTMGYKDAHREIIVEGIMYGRLSAPKGEDGFGFDPIFIPEGYENTLAELGPDIKKQISHRRKATEALLAELHQADIC